MTPGMLGRMSIAAEFPLHVCTPCGLTLTLIRSRTWVGTGLVQWTIATLFSAAEAASTLVAGVALFLKFNG